MEKVTRIYGFDLADKKLPLGRGTRKGLRKAMKRTGRAYRRSIKVAIRCGRGI